MASELKILGCEVSLQNFKNSSYYEHLSTVEKDSIHIYDALKSKCRYRGHTYLVENHMIQYKEFSTYDVNSWKEAFQFLEKYKIVVREKRSGDRVIYLAKFWWAERTIAKYVASLFSKKDAAWTFDIDFDR